MIGALTERGIMIAPPVCTYIQTLQGRYRLIQINFILERVDILFSYLTDHPYGDR
ncbi:hypothetical protein SAMN05446935_7456 [Burkholderia sp. YR290]|jgi:hypothetical protein|nr:hypothetical protein SAMN05446935_7456 [Burkholderia sp. YR290]